MVVTGRRLQSVGADKPMEEVYLAEDVDGRRGRGRRARRVSCGRGGRRARRVSGGRGGSDWRWERNRVPVDYQVETAPVGGNAIRVADLDLAEDRRRVADRHRLH